MPAVSATSTPPRSYGTEPGIARWLQAMPEVRKNIFLATKDLPKAASQMMGLLDRRLATLKTDYVDLFFVHALGDDDSVVNPIEFARSRQFARAIEAIKNSGKAKFVGFSTHHPAKAQIIQSAAEGGFVDVIMVSYTPWLEKDDPINLALDAAYAKGIGLVSMKQLSGSDADRLNFLGQVSLSVPGLQEKGFSAYQGLLQAIWSDERISSCCVSMRNLDQIAENSYAARTFQPLQAAQLQGLRKAFLASRPTMCANCDGPMLPGRRDRRRARHPDAVPHLPRASWLPGRGSPAVRRTLRIGQGLEGGRPRSRPRRVSQPPRLRRPPAQGRSPPGLTNRAIPRDPTDGPGSPRAVCILGCHDLRCWTEVGEFGSGVPIPPRHSPRLRLVWGVAERPTREKCSRPRPGGRGHSCLRESRAR